MTYAGNSEDIATRWVKALIKFGDVLDFGDLLVIMWGYELDVGVVIIL